MAELQLSAVNGHIGIKHRGNWAVILVSAMIELIAVGVEKDGDGDVRR